MILQKVDIKNVFKLEFLRFPKLVNQKLLSYYYFCSWFLVVLYPVTVLFRRVYVLTNIVVNL